MFKNYFLKTVFTFLLCGFFSMSYAVVIPTPTNWYISATGNDDTGDGSMGNPWKSFSKAQTMATGGDVIKVSGMIDFSLEPGLVQPVGVAIAKNLTIQGTSNTADGFDGKGLTRFFSNSTFALTLKNLKLVNGYSGNNNGGAIINTGTAGSLNCENVVFEGNKTGMNTTFAGANKTGGAIHFDNANGSTFKNCIFSNNEASKTGAIYITAWAANSTILFEGCVFVGNIAKESFGGSALFIRSNTSANTTLNMINCTVKGNRVLHTNSNGGAVFFGAKSPATTNVNIINCTISENTTAGSASNTAGMYFLNTTGGGCWGNLYIKNTIIENNTTTTGVYSDFAVGALSPTTAGGGSTLVPGYVKIENSIIGFVTNPSNIPAGNIIASTHFNYLTGTSTTNDFKAGLAPFNTTSNVFPLYVGSNAIGYGNSTFLTGLTPAVTKDQLGNTRTVGATNYAGAWESTPVATTTPSAPTALVATAGDGQLSLAFKSAATGGSNVTNYKYSVNGGGYVALEPAATTSPITITGLTNNTEYTVKLIAVNANGDGAESVASNAVTPTGTTALENTFASIRIYKNTNNQLVIANSSSKAAKVSIFNAVGQQIANRELQVSATIQQKLNAGVYVVMLTIEGKSTSNKIIL